ncbi:Response regulator (fragment) [uncultured delta proteobacterium]|uniref:Response regulator n=1 Tax=uncultured delta proteobacterium TaxID=34034 RepID=A0A212KHQ9_9DELT
MEQPFLGGSVPRACDTKRGIAVKTILVVDDNVTNLRHVSGQLAGEYAVIMAKSGGQALAIVAEKVPDLIVLDIEMPGMDGFATLAALRQNAALARIPVIFLTANHDPETRIKALAAGGVDFVRKPFEKEALLRRIGLHLNLSGGRQRLEKE